MEMIKNVMAGYYRNYSLWHEKKINIPNGLNIPKMYCQSPATITKLC